MAFEWWMLGAAANVAMVVVFALIANNMIRAIIDGNQWRTNPILVATAAVFTLCSIGHGVHLLHLMEPYLARTPVVGAVLTSAPGGLDLEVAAASRVAMSDPLLLTWDVLTGLLCIAFWTLRSRLEYLVEGNALNIDMEQRQQEALELHDDVVQSLVEAKASFDVGDRAAGQQAIETALRRAKRITGRLLGDEDLGHVKLGPQDLRLDEERP